MSDPPISVVRAGPSERVTVEYAPRTVRMHYISDQELDGLRAGSASPSLALFGVTAGAAVTAAVTLATVDLQPWGLASFVGGLVASGGLTVFFGAMALREYRALARQVEAIKSQRRSPGL